MNNRETRPYSYAEATCRNIGLLTEAEQEALSRATVAIAGMGAAGGYHAMALARLGVRNFSIADPDDFDTVNLHRQAGASLATLGRNKAEVMAEMIAEVNPEANVRVFAEAIGPRNVDDFLDGADIYADGIDFFQVDAHRLLFNKSREKGIWAITAAPIGYGSSVQVFDPQGMSFDRFFSIKDGMTRAERLIFFAAGLLPCLPKKGQMKSDNIDFQQEKGPALISAIMICSGVMITEILRILLRRGGVKPAPMGFYFDPYGRAYSKGRALFARTALRNMLVRGIAFRRYPELRLMHEEELAARAGFNGAQGATPATK